MDIINQSAFNAKFFYMFMMFIWMARTSPLTGFNFGNNPILMPIYLLILLIYYIKYCSFSYKPLVILITAYLTWFTLCCIKYGSIQHFYFQPIYYFVITHVAFNIYTKSSFCYFFERILTLLCKLSLSVWLLVNLFPSIFLPLMHSIAIIENNPPTETHSFIIGVGSQLVMGIRRNIGFTWEPGIFSCFIAFGIYINLIVNQFRIKKNRNLYIYLITLVTTLSTTGFMVLGVLVLFFIYNTSTKVKLLLTPLLLLLLPFIWGLSFIGEKLIILSDLEQDISSINYSFRLGYDTVTPQRFAGFYFSFQNFIHDFWLGFCSSENSYATQVLFNGKITLLMSEGILRIFANYGIFVGTFCYYALFKSSIYISKLFDYKGKYFFALFFMVISFSYDFWENCFMIFFYLFPFYINCSKCYKSYIS